MAGKRQREATGFIVTSDDSFGSPVGFFKTYQEAKDAVFAWEDRKRDGLTYTITEVEIGVMKEIERQQAVFEADDVPPPLDDA